ncbi:MAG: lipocalin-like domain-containing protein [Patescibacteria group bacterium]
MQQVRFPRDEQQHNHIIEWWYWNGHLVDGRGNRYSYMNCLFRADIKRVNFPFLKGVQRLPFRTVFFSHSLLTDIGKKKFYPRIEYVATVSKDSFTRPLLYVNYADPIIVDGYVNKVMEEPELFTYRIKNEDIDLNLTSKKPPLLEGGKGYVNLVGDRSTYYYSLTDLRTAGHIRVGKKLIPVIGKSWMDHQWANIPYEKNKWNWFSFQLDNNIEVMAVEYGRHGKKTKLASVCYKSGKQLHSDAVRITPVGRAWVSPKTKARYPLEWRVELPAIGIELTAKAPVKQQEMLYGTLNYWEGPLDVTGTVEGTSVSGLGFCELVGYESEFDNMKFIRTSLTELIRSGYDYLVHMR